MKLQHRVTVVPGNATLDGKTVSSSGIPQLYREFAGDYPKFFKMDSLCRLGFVAAEILLKDIPAEILENASIILFNRNGSLITDRNYQATILPDNYFPSPALFVYTLANIVTGEIAIRHKIYGESSMYVIDDFDPAVIERIASESLLTSSPSIIIAGWVDFNSDSDYVADLRIYSPEDFES